MNRDAQRIIKDVQSAWNGIRIGMAKMYQASDVRPNDALKVFQLENGAAAGEIKFKVNPIVFKMPEKANSRDVSLFIGALCISWSLMIL
jgi:hypothetical protein